MRQINVSLGQRSYPILIGPGLLGRADERLSTLPVKRWAADSLSMNKFHIHFRLRLFLLFHRYLTASDSL